MLCGYHEVFTVLVRARLARQLDQVAGAQPAGVALSLRQLELSLQFLDAGADILLAVLFFLSSGWAAKTVVILNPWRADPALSGSTPQIFGAPNGWNGDASDISTHLVQTFKRLGGKGITGDDKDALMAYVGAMRPPPERKAKDPAAVLRGQAIFRSAGAECSSCHGMDGDLPDGVSHDVKSRVLGDQRTKFDTPSLRFVSGSAPYFHDGRYKDLQTLLARSDGKMGHTKHLAPNELGDLATYLESL